MNIRESLQEYCKIKSEELALKNSYYSKLSENKQKIYETYNEKKKQVEELYSSDVLQIEKQIKDEENNIEKIKNDVKQENSEIDSSLNLSRAKILKKDVSEKRDKSKTFNYNFYDSLGDTCSELAKKYKVEFDTNDYNKQKKLTYESCDKRFAFSYGVRKIFPKLGLVGDIVLIVCFLIAFGSVCSLFAVPSSEIVAGISVAICAIFIFIGVYDLVIGKIIDKKKSKEASLINDCVKNLDKINSIISNYGQKLKQEITKESKKPINVFSSNIESLKENIENFNASKMLELNDIDKECNNKIDENKKQIDNMFKDDFNEYKNKLSNYSDFENAFRTIKLYKEVNASEFYDYYHDFELNNMDDFKYATKKINEVLEEKKQREEEEMRKQEQERLEKRKKEEEKARLLNALQRKCNECEGGYACPLREHLTSPCASFRPRRSFFDKT